MNDVSKISSKMSLCVHRPKINTLQAPNVSKNSCWRVYETLCATTKLSSPSCLPVPERTNSHKTVKKHPSVTVGYVVS